MAKLVLGQASLFEEASGSGEKRDLIIVKKTNRVLSKNQQTFNRYVKKIEKLQHELQQTEKKLEEKIVFYGQQIHPLEQETVVVLTKLVKQLYSFYKGSLPISKEDRKILKEIIAGQLNKIMSLSTDPPDEELKKIFRAVEGISYEKAKEEGFEMMKEEMAEMFEDFGFDIDIDSLDNNLTPEEMMKKMKEMEAAMKEQMEQMTEKKSNWKRKKTKKQAEKEERQMQMEEARKKNITSIYRQLAKVLHPDLELDAGIRAEKEILMKQLTEAYKNNDLHTLLRLELQWVQKEENNPELLTEEKLGIYNEVLKEQAQDIEQAIMALSHHPRFSPLQRFCRFFESAERVNLIKIKKEMNESLLSIRSSIQALHEKNALNEIKKVVSIFRDARQNNFMEDFF